ncbi:MAG TPA: aminomethyltransferase beta-barrel domain-containing protein, partial [Blastocatellia bacterium]|nr:aminomethyltransferase beta-barrel domain-containing protein [Blastocatellia bacterium]
REMGKTAGADAALDQGAIETSEGRVLGEHAGLYRYTVGQRKGIGVSSPEPLYVVKIDVPRNRLVVGKRDELYQASLVATGVNWISISPPVEPVRASVRIRYRAVEAAATIEVIKAGEVRVDFDSPQAAITPGQAAVFYDGDRVVGGGWIRSAGDGRGSNDE